jgi:FAD/FMN-containing dehydrogenase
MSHIHLTSWTGIPPPRPYRAVTIEWTQQNPFPDRDALVLPRGYGRSYGDGCLPCDTAILTHRLDRIRSFDTERGIIAVEAGISLGELLRITIPRGWVLPVLPGTGAVSIGGAIANDIHGKSHHWAGTIGRWIERFELVRSDGRALIAPTEQSELFSATIGGLGLTGIVTWAELRLHPCPSAQMETLTIPFASLDEYFALMPEIEREGNYVVAWCDLSRKGRVRGMIHASQFADDQCDGGGKASLPPVRQWQFRLPLSIMSRPAVRILNALRCISAPRQHRGEYTRIFFPLDRLPWNGLFGRRGFFQLQAVLPQESEVHLLRSILRRLWDAHLPLPLVVLKHFAPIPSPGMLSFPMAGTSIAVDVPNTARARSTLKTIIAEIAESGGRVYPAKDVLMRPEQFQRMYPQWVQLERYRDPRFCSQFWQRVTGCR